MAIRRIGGRIGRAWGNALGGWKAQPRNPMGRFMGKGGGGGSKANYRPSRNQIAAQNAQKKLTQQQRAERNKKVAKNVAIVGGAALLAGGAYVGARRVGIAQTNLYDSRRTTQFVRNAAKTSRGMAGGANVARSTGIRAGSFSPVPLSPRAPLGLRGFSRAGAASHNINRLLPPVSFSQNTRRPSQYRYSGDALKNVQVVDMNGRELIPKRDMTREIRSINMRKTNWKKKANTAAAARAAQKAASKPKTAPTKAEAKAAVQNPKPASTPAAKNTPPSKPPAKPKAKTQSPKPKKDTTPKSKNVPPPKAHTTVAETAPAQPAVGAGSKKTKSSPAKQAATGGNKPVADTDAAAKPSKSFYEDNYAPLRDDPDVQIVGNRIQALDEDGQEIIIPIAGRRGSRSSKPVGGRPGQKAPRAMNQPKPQETVQKKASTGSSRISNEGASVQMIPAEALAKPSVSADHTKAWYSKEFDVEYLKLVARQDSTKAQIVAGAIAGGVSKARAKQFGDAVADIRKADKRARGRTLDGKKMSKDEARAASMAGAMVVTTKSHSQRIADMNDKMANGKMAPPNMTEIKNAEEMLRKMAGMHNYTADMLWREATVNKASYSVAERKAMRLLSNWKNLQKTMK